MSTRVPRWLPNAISSLRIALVPVWLLVAEALRSTADPKSVRYALVGILIGLGASDVVDGFVARRFGLTSKLGATLDAVADKLAQVAFVTYLVLRTHPHLHSLPLWFWAMLVARDVSLVVGYVVVRAKHGTVDTEHDWHGKLASVLLFFVVMAAILAENAEQVVWTTYVTAPVVAFSTLSYLKQGLVQLREGS